MAVEQQACLQATREQWRPSSLAAAAQVVVLLLVTGDCPSWALQCRTNMSQFESYTAALRNNPGLLPVRNTQIGRATGFFLRPAGPPCCVFPGLLRCGIASPAAAAGCQRCRQGALPCYSRAWRRHQQRACVRQPQEHLAACTCGVVHAVPPCSCSLEYAERQRISAAQDTTCVTFSATLWSCSRIVRAGI